MVIMVAGFSDEKGTVKNSIPGHQTNGRVLREQRRFLSEFSEIFIAAEITFDKRDDDTYLTGWLSRVCLDWEDPTIQKKRIV